MLKALFTKIPKFKKYFHFLLSAMVCLSIVCYQSYPVSSQENNNEEELSIVDLEQISQAIAKVEAKWERDYEGYFRRDFTNKTRSTQEIAEHLTEISQQTDINPAVIWAMPMDNFLELILITPDNKLALKKIRSADRPTLELIVSQLNDAIADRESTRYLPPAKQIYQWLIAPLEPYLEAENIDTLLLCTGPTLRSFPFAVLHDGEQFIIEKYNLTRIPAFGLTDTEYEPRPDKQVLAMGASEFKDLPDLPGVAVELSTITPILWEGERFINEDFTVKNLMQLQQQGKFDIVHLATHAQFLPGEPDRSFIQFSDRPLTLDQITKLKLDSPQVDLLVLSACETAVGNEDAEFGFAGLAIQAGVKSVLASLWSINDGGTVALMSQFYQELKSTPIKAEALRKAQLAMLNKTISLESGKLRSSDLNVSLPPELNSDAELKNIDHPFYWAGFTIIGNPW
jgi:CHAT domain-containing protein